MNRTWIWVAVAVAAAGIGYFAGQPRAAAPGGAKGTTIELSWDAATSQCKADTKDKKLKVKKSDDEFVVWRVKRGTCGDHVPAEAIVELRFGADGRKAGDPSPFTEARPSGQKWIFAELTPGVVARSYYYSVWLRLPNGTEYQMEDPEIEIAS